jgi:antitoxin component of RelBE/YafQ-DinJ toxin-antitoxin module
MTLTVRTDPHVSEELAQYCAQAGQTKSDVVKLALAEFLAKQALPKPSAWDLVKDLIHDLERADALVATPLPADLASNRKQYLNDYYADRHAHRRGPADRPMHLADALLVALATQMGLSDIVSIDSDFDIYVLPNKGRLKNKLAGEPPRGRKKRVQR